MAMSYCLISVSVILLVFSMLVISPSRAFLSQNLVQPRGISFRHPAICYASRERWIDERDDEVSYRTRYRGESDEARELRNISYEQEGNVDIVKGDYYYEDEDVEYTEEDVYEAPRTVDDIDEEATGNFWYNPKQGFDPLPSERQGSSRIEEETELHATRRPRPRPSGKPRSKTTFRSGAPSTPEPITDFYDRLFWYGFNPDESIAPGDKTLFGGTKGKFNGLDFFEDDERRKPARRRKRPPQQFRADEWYDDIMDSLDNYEEDEDYDKEMAVSETVGRTSRSGGEMAPQRRRSLPPEEADYSYDDTEYAQEDNEDEETVVSETVRRRPSSEVRTPRRRRSRPPEDVNYEEERYERRSRDAYSDRGRPTSRRRTGDRVSNQISSWFGPNDTEDEPPPERTPRRPRRRTEQDDDDDESWSFTSILDGIFGVNREEVDMNAAMYNKQMGLDRTDRPQRRPERRSRRGQAYPYAEETVDVVSAAPNPRDEDDTIDVVDVDAVIEDEEEPKGSERKRERTIEERSAAFERVPPSGVPAWGPSGSVGVDARTKATLDALEEIREATRKVELKEEQCIEAKEDIVVLKADFELQKKRLLASIDDPLQVRSRLRQMQMGIQDAAHTLRRSRAELEVARERLADLEDRNWALLSLYDADKAFQEVVETFREFEETERLETRLQDSEELATSDENPDETNVESDSSETVEKDTGDEPTRDFGTQ